MLRTDGDKLGDFDSGTGVLVKFSLSSFFCVTGGSIFVTFLPHRTITHYLTAKNAQLHHVVSILFLLICNVVSLRLFMCKNLNAFYLFSAFVAIITCVNTIRLWFMYPCFERCQILPKRRRRRFGLDSNNSFHITCYGCVCTARYKINWIW